MNKKTALFLVFQCLFSVFLAAIAADTVHAAEGGYSNYVPGTYGDFAASLEPPTKWTIRNDFYHYKAEGGRSLRSGLLELDTDLEFNMHFLTALYKSDFEFLGGRYATGIFVPTVVDVDIETDVSILGTRTTIQDNVTRYGDITFIPGVLYWNKDNFHFSLAEYIIAPTGDYDKNSSANAGLNYWTFDTDFAVTYLNQETGQDYSINFGYNYNTENNDTDYQTGQEIHVDCMFNQFLSDSFALGIHGFFLNQITGDSGKGASLGSFKSDASGIGPAILWSPKKFEGNLNFVAKWLHEYDTENRLEGDHIFFSVLCSF